MLQKDHINKKDTYVPNLGLDYPKEPNTPYVNPKITKQIEIDGDYPFLPKTFRERLWNWFTYSVIFTLVFLVQKLRYGLKIKGKKNLRKNKHLFK
ncbi:MAG: 1-acyl-sn-glycerol-3-phosphate acyltransferase, partial [Treponemataceae bacterium]|nr:1-acyl-sn-glycerol-3-phosphate acyltransferase [Treponemataceae bacterium]